MTIESDVRQAILNAYANGYKQVIKAMTDEELADDLQEYDSAISSFTKEEVLAVVKKIREEEK